jgi:hypothetical protein
MRFERCSIAFAALAVAALVAPAADARDGQARGGRSGQAAVRSAPPRPGPARVAPRGPAGPGDAGRHATGARVAVPRTTIHYRSAPRYGAPAPYGYGSRHAVPYYGYRAYPRVYAPRGYRYPYYSHVYHAHPYYAFRPRLNIGFGLWVGYPVAYSYFGYGYPYAAPVYPPYAAYPVYPNTTYVAQPGYAGYASTGPAAEVSIAAPRDEGGVSFEITPIDAAVYVDGVYAGVVSNFTPRTRPLALAPGAHRIEVQAPGYETATFEVTIVAGEVVPFQGQLQLSRP